VCHHCLKSLDGFSRREMLASAAGTAIIGGLLARQAQAAETAASRPAVAREVPEIRAAFLRLSRITGSAGRGRPGTRTCPARSWRRARNWSASSPRT